MSEALVTLRARRHDLWRAAKAVADTAANANRCLTDSEQRSYTQLVSELDELDERIGGIVKHEQRTADTDQTFRQLAGGQAPGLRMSGGDRELRAWMRGEGPHVFEVRQEPVDWPAVQKRALYAGTATGSDTVPTSFYGQLVDFLTAATPVLQVATVLTTESGNDLQVPTVTAHSNAVIVGEGSTIPTSEPGFGQLTLKSYKYGALIQVSTELLNDTGVDLGGFLARQAGEQLGNAFGVHGTVGTGTGQARGYVTDALVGVTSETAAAGPTYDDLVSLFMSVLPQYRRRGTWLANDATIAELRKLKAAGDGQPILVPSATGDSFSIFGRPVVSDPNLADVGTGNRALVFGDMSKYYVRLAGPTRFERSDDFAFDQDMITFRALLRADGALVDTTGAVKAFTSS